MIAVLLLAFAAVCVIIGWTAKGWQIERRDWDADTFEEGK